MVGTGSRGCCKKIKKCFFWNLKELENVIVNVGPIIFRTIGITGKCLNQIE